MSLLGANKRKRRLIVAAGIAAALLAVIAMLAAVLGGTSAAVAAACQLADISTSNPAPPTTAGAISIKEIEETWVEEGGPVNATATMAAVAYAESGDNPAAVNGAAKGLYQIDPGDSGDLNLQQNTQDAVAKYKNALTQEGNGFLPWESDWDDGRISIDWDAAWSEWSNLESSDPIIEDETHGNDVTEIGSESDISADLGVAVTASYERPTNGGGQPEEIPDAIFSPVAKIAAVSPTATTAAATTTTGSLPALPSADSHLLTIGQQQFVANLAAISGLDTGVLSGWVYQEENGSAAASRQADGNMDWLNIGYPGGGSAVADPAHPTSAGYAGSDFDEWEAGPAQAAQQTWGWISGDGTSVPGWQRSVAMTSIIDAAGAPAGDQITGIQQSGWIVAPPGDSYPNLPTDYQTVTNHSVGTIDVSATTSVTDIQTTAADTYISSLPISDQVSYAVVGSTGTVLAQSTKSKDSSNSILHDNSGHPEDKDSAQLNGNQITMAMLLVAYLRTHPNSLTADAKAHLKAMVVNSSLPDANWVYSQVGQNAVQAVATVAGMKHFQLDADGSDYKLANSLVTSIDFAAFFAQIDQDMPAKLRSYGVNLLSEGDSGTNGWGIPASGVSGVGADQSGMDGNGSDVTQAAQIELANGTTIGVAIFVKGAASQAAAENVIQMVASSLVLSTTTSTSIDLSSLSPVELAALRSLANKIRNTDPAACQNAETNATVPITAGPSPTYDSSAGTIAAPASAPEQVKEIIAAGNQIHTLPYISGGGHGDLAELAPGYDCSGMVSYMLYKAGLIPADGSMVNTGWNTYGDPGPGKYVTIYSNTDPPGTEDAHAFIEVDGEVMDTADYAPVSPAGSGPRWQPASIIAAQTGPGTTEGHWVETHPPGL